MCVCVCVWVGVGLCPPQGFLHSLLCLDLYILECVWWAQHSTSPRCCGRRQTWVWYTCSYVTSSNVWLRFYKLPKQHEGNVRVQRTSLVVLLFNEVGESYATKRACKVCIHHITFWQHVYMVVSAGNTRAVTHRAVTWATVMVAAHIRYQG